MPSAAARRLYEDQIPSFMSVFDLDNVGMEDQTTITVVDSMISMDPSNEPKMLVPPTDHVQRNSVSTSDLSHKHNDSTSTQNSESAESSPTTTLSCTDSSSLSDPSPSSSPDSPVNLVALSSYPATSFGGLGALTSLTVSDTNLERPMTSPAPRRPKNMKGLSIQPPSAGNMSSSLLVSEPASPSFIKPVIPAMKRKPSQLSLKTKTSDLIARTTLEIPNSPAMAPILLRRGLKHSISSPHMLSSLQSSTFGPVGGMTIPPVLERNESGLSEFFRPSKPGLPPPGFQSTILEEDSPIRPQIANRSAFEIEPFREHENDEDQKSPGYPDGPIAIYGEDVYLYLEPTADEAAKFDVVINVAREVPNPFEKKPAPSLDRSPVQSPMVESPIPDTALTTASYATAFEFPPEDATPTTPKAAMFPPRQPEYVHIPWDHNTDIADDLMTLCGTIDKKVKEGKKVLVHCQQGASRSASLIIAYGLYINPDLSVNDAYNAAQGKSRWISPNMKLMYCLQDFQKEVSRRKQVPNSGLRPRTGRSPTKHRATLSVDAIETSSKEPLTAPLMSEDGSTRGSSPDRTISRPRGNSTPGREPISPGPSSAPSSFSWTEREDESDFGKFGRFNVDELSDSSVTTTTSSPPEPRSNLDSLTSTSFLELPGKPLGPCSKPPPSPGFGHHRFGSQAAFGFAPINIGPMVEDEQPEQDTISSVPITQMPIISDFQDDAALMSPRVETMTNNPLRGPVSDFGGLHFVESPPTPSEGLFSPRETIFPRNPFHPFGRPTQIADPRSPPTRGETPIVRSIDELI